MTNSSEQFGLLLADLWGRGGESNLILRDVESGAPKASRLLLGVNAQGQRHVLAPIPADFAFKAEQGESIELTEWSHPTTGVRYLDLICHDELLSQPFEQLTDSIVDRVANRESPHIAIQEAIKDMQKLLKPGRVLAENLARGIFGELVVLSWLAQRNAHYAVDAWHGPDPHVHDFSTAKGDLEVKSSGNDSRSVTISSLSQLDEVAETPLVLIRLHVQSAPQGKNLEEMINGLVALGCNHADLVNKLEGEGFRLGIDSDEHRFIAPIEALAWRVGSTFPGLRRGDLPIDRGEAITQIKYTLNLLSAPGAMTAFELQAYMDGMMSA
ncbi:PD-(D/E)XK motif protein [Tessaracoccus antarcticus]|uniref:PD-(D/E)XK motif protein n=1 Tax=Tessaracoccus antarcticus TaxID=2479848 RepID=A0A3M0GVT2_9ACTN|nr:PD-(D/E)XK motif protein [Tessaracoccus antarcticus]RMB61446.1 PD-(D/E)XK motif protein [Tessaracoccus antarcticus]